MKKLLFISVFFIVISFVFAQAVPVDVNVLRQIVEILQKLIQGGQVQVPSPPTTMPTETPRHEIETPEVEKKIEQAPGPSVSVEAGIIPVPLQLPRGIKPALPQVIQAKPITPEVIKPILPDEDRSDDAIVQINNLRITRILLNPRIENVKAIFFVIRDVEWKCLFFESEESEKSLPCDLDLRRSILQKELAVQISNDTILLKRNRQRAKLEDFKAGDKINVYGFMDKDNYSIDALIVRNVVSVPKPMPKLMPKPIELKLPVTSTPRVCIQVITPAYNPQNPSECKEFPTPCDIPPGWLKTDRCPVKTPILQTPTTQTQTRVEAKVEADDYGFYPSSLEFRKGEWVNLHLYVRSDKVYYGGLEFRSEKFKTEPIKPGEVAKAEFIADKDFVVESYWPVSNVKKAELKIVVK